MAVFCSRALLEHCVLITGKFRGLGLPMHRCKSKSQNSNREQAIIAIFDRLKIKCSPLIFLLRHLR